MTMKIFRKDLLIENLRKTLLNDNDSCYWCPFSQINTHVNCGGICSDERADEFRQAIIKRFSSDVEVVDSEID